MWDAPPPAVPPAGAAEFLPGLDMPPPRTQNRWTVLLRLLLLIPQFLVVWVLSVAAFFVAVAGWFGALVLGRLPDFAATYLGGYVTYETRVNASAMLLHDRYPPFAFRAPEHPVQVELRPGPLNRLAVFFRLVLVIPAVIVQAVLLSGWWTLSFFSWIVVLVLGRTPTPLWESTAAILRYRMRYQAYLLMLSSAYPKRLFGEDERALLDEPVPGWPTAGAARSATRPLVLSGAGRGLLVVFILVGILASATSSVTRSLTDDDDDYDHAGVSGPLRPGPGTDRG